MDAKSESRLMWAAVAVLFSTMVDPRLTMVLSAGALGWLLLYERGRRAS